MLVELEVDGMHCAGCARAIGNALSRVPAVGNVDIDLGNGRVSVHAGVDLDVSALISAAAAAGYEARVPTSGR